MPEFNWEPMDFLEVLGVLPETDEFKLHYQYIVERGLLKVELSIWIYDSDVHLSLYVKGQEAPVFYLGYLNALEPELLMTKEVNV